MNRNEDFEPQPTISLSPSERTVWVRFTSERFHRWLSAPDDVLHRHLRDQHRHLFHVKVGVRVSHSDRDISFELLSRDAQGSWMTLVPKFSYLSCEAMAERLGSTLLAKGYRVLIVEVSEDGENGATLVWSPAEAESHAQSLQETTTTIYKYQSLAQTLGEEHREVCGIGTSRPHFPSECTPPLSPLDERTADGDR